VTQSWQPLLDNLSLYKFTQTGMLKLSHLALSVDVLLSPHIAEKPHMSVNYSVFKHLIRKQTGNFHMYTTHNASAIFHTAISSPFDCTELYIFNTKATFPKSVKMH
jgi:hypothetical protein